MIWATIMLLLVVCQNIQNNNIPKTIKRILVTGEAGLIGSYLCEKLVNERTDSFLKQF